MGYYLDEHPQNRPQQKPRTAWGWQNATGLVTVHVAVSAIDKQGPDTGAEGVAQYICNRPDPGGYHEIVDSDSFVQMARDEMMTWHTAAGNLNGPGWGISAACKPDDWNPADPWTQKTITTMGARIRAFWQRRGLDPAKCARWLNQGEGLKGTIPGLVHHGVVQPGDRYDAWVKLSNGQAHPHRPRLDQMLIDAIRGGDPGGDDVLDPTDITKIVDGVVAALKPDLTGLARGEQVIASALPDRTAMKQDGNDPQQFYIDRGPDGYRVRFKLKDQDEVKLLQLAGFLDTRPEPVILNGDGNDPITKAFNALPIQPAPWEP